MTKDVVNAFTRRSIAGFQGIVSLYVAQARTEALVKKACPDRRLLEIYDSVVVQNLSDMRNMAPDVRPTDDEIREIDYLCSMFRRAWDSPELQILDPGEDPPH